MSDPSCTSSNVPSADYIYLHGFASGPRSAKAQDLRDRFEQLQIDLKIPDLNQGNFSHLTLTRQLDQVATILPPPEISTTLIGSSFGGLTAAWAGEQHAQIEKLVLLAPAFDFLSHWLPKLGPEQVQQWQTEQYLSVYHYAEGRSLPLSYQFVLDAERYPSEQLQRSIPTLILHGREDEVIPIQASRTYAAQRPWVQLIELESDHALGNVYPQIWERIQQFCGL